MKQVNQTAHLARLEWPDDIGIKYNAPLEYVPKIRPRFSGEDWRCMYQMHALPDKWESMPYDEFLQTRRVLMAMIIRRGFESLT